MEIKIIESNEIKIAQVVSSGTEIKNTQDALDLMANCSYLGARKIIVNKEIFVPEFFDLKNGIAGEILNKFANYRVQLAIVGDFSVHQSKPLHDFIYESNKIGQIIFCDSTESAKLKLLQ